VSEAVVEVRDLWTRFGINMVHRGIDLTVHRGEVMSLVGGSGSGKTTLLRQMLGLEVPYRGEVRVLGAPVHRCDAETLRRLRVRWGVLFQEGALFSALTVYDNVALPLREMRTVDEEMIRDLVLMKLEMVGIGARHARKYPAELSGGMVKRIALARALALEPELLFLDEPTAGLDPDRSESFVALIQSLRRELGLTVVMVTHDLDTLVALSSRIAVLFEGKLVVLGTLREVVRSPHPFIVNFFLGDRGKRALQTVWDTLGVIEDRPRQALQADE
jgi:phospholipid/cholesterol/gamma-HCH transport system ATP-binding protein